MGDYNRNTDKYLYGKMTRTASGDASRYLEEETFGRLYPDEEIGPAYRRWHNILITSFYPDETQEMAINILLLAYRKKIDIDNWKPWLLYFGTKSTSIARKISGFTNITKIAFMPQKKMESKGVDLDDTFW